jgi:hypothetical protein
MASACGRSSSATKEDERPSRRCGVVKSDWSHCDYVYIIGGGPSLKHFPFQLFFDLLLNHYPENKIVAVNGVVFKCPRSHAVVSVDNQWIRATAARLSGFHGERVLGLATCENDPTESFSQDLFTWETMDGLSADPSVLYSPSSSGYAAVNFAVLKGAHKIILLGYDYSQAGSNWHEGYPWQRSLDDDHYQLWADKYQTMKPCLQELGVQVLNYSLDSRIDAFPKHDWRAMGLKPI